MGTEDRAGLRPQPGAGPDPALVYHDGDGRACLHPLVDDRVTIGRGPGNDLTLAWDMSVSRVHAELERLGDDWAVADDGLSRNGTYLNGERLSGRRRLQEGDTLRIGATLLVFRRSRTSDVGGTVLADEVPSPSSLSSTQRKVLEALCRPYKDSNAYAVPATNQQIAQELFLSVDAVKTHLRTLFTKFNVEQLPQNQKRARLVQLAFTSGLIRNQDL